MTAAPDPDLIPIMRRAVHLHQQGLLDEAERLYREILARAPEQPDALHFLGVIESQRGRHEAAVALLDRALLRAPVNATILYHRANALRDLGRLDEALSGYDAALSAKPGHLGALNNRGAVLHALARYGEAVASYDGALALDPDYADAWTNRGNALLELGRAAEALESFDRALRLVANHLAALYGRGNALAKLNRPEEAASSYDRALELAPRNPDLLNNRGNVLCQLGRYEEALESFDRALSAGAAGAEIFNNRGNVFMQLRRHAEALADYDRALERRPLYAEALYGRGSALAELKRPDEAVAAFRQVLQLRPDHPYALGMLVFAQASSCDWREDSVALLLEEIRRGGRAATPLVLLAVSDSAPDKLRCSEIVMRDKYPASREPLWRGEDYAHGRIRLAYLSADFRTHPVAAQIAGVFEHHDRSRFETIAVSYGPDDGGRLRARLMRGSDRFLDVREESDRGIARILREMEIDIAVDLTGLTAGGRPGILSLRPAPVQVGFLGFAASMGADHMDYILADRIVIPEGDEAFYREKVVRLPGSYMPHDSARAIASTAPSRADQGLPEEGFVFAAFSSVYKITKPVFAVWMRLLAAAEGSVLWLASAAPCAMRNLAREAEAHGISPARLVFARYLPAPEDHLARLKLADLFLDTFPYNAHSTACDALWAGLPVLTCQGKSFASRVGASLLYAAGLPELVTDSLSGYEACALSLACDPSALGGLRARLRESRTTCRLFDTAAFTRDLEAAYVQMWRRARRGEAPRSFSVEPGLPVDAP